MPDASGTTPGSSVEDEQEVKPECEKGHRLKNLARGQLDPTGTPIEAVMVRNDEYAIYRSRQGVYVHFSDDKTIERSQVSEYTKLSVQLCELRYLTNQMRPSAIKRLLRFRYEGTLYDHNMAQAFMLLMEAAAQRRIAGSLPVDSAAAADVVAAANSMEDRATQIASRALEMAVKRNTTDNTIRYVTACVGFGIAWLSILFALQFLPILSGHGRLYLAASAAGVVGAVFSVVVRAQSLDLKPCDDSGLNYMMSGIRTGMGGLAGPLLVLLFATVFTGSDVGPKWPVGGQLLNASNLQTICLIGFVAGFAERLVPSLVQATASKMEVRAGTPGQTLAGDRAEQRPTPSDDLAPKKQPG